MFGADLQDFYDAGGGESGYIAVRPDNPDIVYAGSYGGYLTRKDTRTGIERDINPWPLNPMGHDARDAKYRIQWTFPIVISPHDPNTLYVGVERAVQVHRRGDSSWTAISARPDPERSRDPGPLRGPDHQGPDQRRVLRHRLHHRRIAGGERGDLDRKDDGLVQVTRDSGATWTNVTPHGLPRVDAGFDHRGVGPRQGHRVSRRQPLPAQ